ncbi:MAG TPA: DUF1571 domain-containing protein [Gemmataceae bacterium]|jgi:hypothetical protein
MKRALICLPFCLLCTSDSPSIAAPPIAIYRDVADSGSPLPSETEMERLARNDPIAFMRNCIRRYDREVEGFTATLRKQERHEGQLQRSEVIDVFFRENPFSVLLRWTEGGKRAATVLYVKGQNRDQLLVRPSGLLAFAGIVTRDPRGDDAKQAGRYPLTEFGIKIGMQRTLSSWESAQNDNALHVEYLGVKKIKELGERPCWVVKRTRYAAPEVDGITEATFYIDKDTWLQVGTVLKGQEGKLIGEYFFRDVKINPEFASDTFTREALKR